MNKIEIFGKNHYQSVRQYLPRMNNNKVDAMKIAKEYGYDYWDGNRQFGYGGYVYDGRFASVAESLINQYKLTAKSKVLDFGCGKGYLLFEIKKILNCDVVGLDISEYAIEHAKPEIKNKIILGSVDELSRFKLNEFDLVLSNMTLHNLTLEYFEQSLKEFSRIGKKSLITMESYRNTQELFNLQCWALTCNLFFSQEDWQYLLGKSNYRGDYELMFFI
jgi:SAM-dependent methyltransferase